MNQPVLLVGAPRAGTSVVGAALAAQAGWPFVDCDALLLRATGHSRKELAEDGALERAERDVLTMLLGLPAPLVATLAVGMLSEAGDRARVAAADARVIWLRAKVSTLARRSGGRVDPQGRVELQRRVEEWAPLFAEVADVVVDVDQQTPAQLVRAVQRRLDD